MDSTITWYHNYLNVNINKIKQFVVEWYAFKIGNAA